MIIKEENILKISLSRYNRSHVIGILYNIYKGHVFSFKSILYFIIDIYLRPKNHKAFVLLDLSVLICFFDKDFVKRYRLLLIKKTKHMHIKFIVSCLLSFSHIKHKFFLIDVTKNSYNNLKEFNIILFLSNLSILDLLILK